MQTKTIKKNIQSKLEEWLTSITDQSLKNELKKNILVSGGSIASMFLNEEVNDYDVYLKDINVVKNLCQYYVKNNPSIIVLDGREKAKLVSKLEEDYKEFFALVKANDDEDGSIEDINNAYAISVRNLKEDQIKLFFDGKNGGYAMDYEEDKKTPYRPVYFSPNAISLSDNLQIVIRFHGDNEAIHSTFDFIHATNYFTFEDGLVTNKEALESLLTKQLKYSGSLYPLTSIIRVRKFIKRGWNIGAGELLKIMFQISELDLKNPDVLEEQLIGVDVAYFDNLISILRGVSEEKMTSAYLNAIIDRVFDSE
jgi:hypothetical protein